MPKAEVKFRFVVDVSDVQRFIDAMTEASERIQDQWRCPSVEPLQALRCELPRDHGVGGGGPKRHHHGRISWPSVAESTG